MRRLQRILLERKTRRFVDQMIHNYSDIRLSATTRAMSRKRPRIEVTGVRRSPVNADHDRGEHSDMAAELSTSSCCQTESERSSTLSSTMFDSEPSQSAKGHERQQQQEEARMSEAPTVSEYGSTLSSTRLTRLLEEEGGEYDNQESMPESSRESATSSAVSTQQETESNQEHSSVSECDTSSANLESSVGNQIDEQSQLSECSTESPPTSSTTETLPSETLPRLRPAAPTHCVVPNCCDYFTSPHPHYPKEVIGLSQKVEEPLNDEPSQSDSASSEVTSGAANNERENQSDGRSVDQSNNNTSVDGRDSDFEMWDYVCPQHARRGYANEWI